MKRLRVSMRVRNSKDSSGPCLWVTRWDRNSAIQGMPGHRSGCYLPCVNMILPIMKKSLMTIMKLPLVSDLIIPAELRQCSTR